LSVYWLYTDWTILVPLRSTV
jgi:hypothetical protein